MSVIAEYRRMGRIRNVGVSEVSIEQLQLAESVVPITAVQNEYNLDARKHDEVVDFCAEREILFVPFFPLRAPRDRRSTRWPPSSARPSTRFGSLGC